jgi:hypothetical protein
MSHRTSATFHGCYFNAQDEQLTHEQRHDSQIASAQLLDTFLSLKGEARAARWRQFDFATKFQVVAQQMARTYGDWTADEVEGFVAKYDAKWEVGRPDSDLSIPPAADVLAVVKDRLDVAAQHGDAAGVHQLNRVRMNITNGARLAWHMGDLLVQSVNTPGQVYSVSRRGCTCPNGAAGKAQCWHVAIFDILEDMREEDATTADMAADAAAARQEEELTDDQAALIHLAERAQCGSLHAARELGQRIAAVRACYLGAL